MSARIQALSDGRTQSAQQAPVATESGEPQSAVDHATSVWRDDYDEWVWSCTCSPDLHGGYATAGRAGQEAAWHEEAPDGT